MKFFPGVAFFFIDIYKSIYFDIAKTLSFLLGVTLKSYK